MTKDIETSELDENQRKIITAISQSLWGITQSELASETGLHRNTVSKYLHVLMAKNLVANRRYGRTEVWFISKDRLEKRLQAPRTLLQSMVASLRKLKGDNVDSRQLVEDMGYHMISSLVLGHNTNIVFPEVENHDGLKAFFNGMTNFFPLFLHYISVRYDPSPEFQNQGQLVITNCLCDGSPDLSLACSLVAGAIRGGVSATLGLDLSIAETTCAVGSPKTPPTCVFSVTINNPPF